MADRSRKPSCIFKTYSPAPCHTSAGAAVSQACLVEILELKNYMSTLSTRIRGAWKPVGAAYAYSATLPEDMEQALGCDT